MKGLLLLVSLLLAVVVINVYASSHSEAPNTSIMPQTDSTDMYAFQSYETGRSGFTTLIANYNPRQAPYGGPNYYALDNNFHYNIHIDNTGLGIPTFTYQFSIINEISHNGFGIAFNIGPKSGPRQIPIALKQLGPVNFGNTNGNLNYLEYFRLNVVNDVTATSSPVTQVGTLATAFAKPFDNAGNKTFPISQDYATYANNFIYNINIPGCATPGRVFVGQRADPFAIALGQIFDLININPPIAAGSNPKIPGIQQSNANNVIRWTSIEAFALEVPTTCLTGSGSGVIGVWTTTTVASGKTFTGRNIVGRQKSRIGNPLINELFIGLGDKDKWSGRTPYQDGLLNQYIQYPTFPTIVSSLFLNYVNQHLGTKFKTLAPTNYPRNDLVAIFLTGIPGINFLTATGKYYEYLRLNTTIPPVTTQNTLGVIGGDLAGYPNGRRPGDDVIDIALRAAMGVICTNFASLKVCTPSQAVVGGVAFTDGAPEGTFGSTFPYLNTPASGSLDIL